MGSILINFSGHLLSEDALLSLSARHEEIVQAKPINFDFSGPVDEQLEAWIKGLPCLIDGTRPISLIPPGQSTLSILLITYIHGLIGHFPSLCYLELGDSGVYLPKAEYLINSNKIRSAGRRFRAKLFATK